MRKVFTLLFFSLFIFFNITNAIYAAEVINLNVTVSNASEFEKKTLPVKTYLPKGIKPDDVVQKGNFSVGYDFEKSLYFAYQDIELEPKASATLDLGIRDVWVVPLDEVKTLKNHTEKILKVLEKTDFADESKKIGRMIIIRLDKIIADQNPDLSMEDRVLAYEENMAILQAQKKEIGTLEDMAIETGTLGQINELMGESVSTVENMGDGRALDSLIIKMSVTNPFSDERVVPFKYYLPIEVQPEFIKNSGGLNAGYDYQRGVYYLYNDTVKFAANESKDFAIEINDLWVISSDKIQTVKKRTQRLIGLLAATEYQDLGATLGDKIISTLDGILGTQVNKEESIENHIGSYRTNIDKFSDALKDMSKMERLLIQSGGSIARAMVDNKAPKAEGKGKKTEGSLKTGAKRGIEIFHKEELKGKAPDIAMTWRVIWYIIGFLGLLTLMFFILWWTELRTGADRIYNNIGS